MQTPTIRRVVRFDLASGEYNIIMQASDYVVDTLAHYLGIEEHHLIPLISSLKQFVQVEFQVPQGKQNDLEQKIKEIKVNLEKQGWLKDAIKLSPMKSDVSQEQK